LTRREWLQVTGLGAAGWSVSGWFGLLAQALSREPNRKKSCILLWMAGGPSQLDTFDPKPQSCQRRAVQADCHSRAWYPDL
jgi:hypothetical protein